MADDFARQLLDALYNPETQPPQQPSRPLREKLAGAAETAATIGTGLLGSVPAGLAGLTQMIPTRGRAPSVNRAAQKVEDVQSALTYLPRTEAGQEYLEKTAGALGVLGMPAEFLGEQTLKLTGSPFLATVANVGLDPVNYIGMPGSGKAAVATGKALGRAAAAAPRVAGEMASDLLMGQGRMEGQRGAIKMKGGNWLPGNVEDATKPLKIKGLTAADRQYAMDRVEAIRERGLEPTVDDLRQIEESFQNEAINNWIDKKLNRYIKNEMATPEDPVRKLADQGILHYQPEDLYPDFYVTELRKEAGLPEEGFAKTQLGESWETHADTNIAEQKAGELKKYLRRKEEAPKNSEANENVYIQNLIDEAEKRLRKDYGDMTNEELGKDLRVSITDKNRNDEIRKEAESVVRWQYELDPESLLGPQWSFKVGSLPPDKISSSRQILEKIPEEASVYGIGDQDYAMEALQFPHLIDELKNAIDPNSDLPAHLRWKPEDLEKVSMEQAVKRVHDINEYRASKKAEANEVLARNPATVTFKEYPTIPGTDKPNEKGLAWKEIREPEAAVDKATSRQQLQEALRYEGDVMGHCVGGYCDNVLSGRSQIYSLRDKKGEPLVTIEVERMPRMGFRPGEGPKTPSEDQALRYEWIKDGRSRKIGDEVTFAEWWRSKNGIPEPGPEFQITQIKGSGKRDSSQRLRIKQNGYENEPDAYLLPFIQDFIRSGNWSRVGDIKNTGLEDIVNYKKAVRVAAEKAYPGQRFLTLEQIQPLVNAASEKKMKSGGSVYISDNPDTMRLELAGGGAVATARAAAKAAAKAVEPSIVRPGNPIQGAVVLIGDQMFLGRTHADALNRAIYEGVVRKENNRLVFPPGAEVDSDLFMTRDGRVIDRLTAFKEMDIGASESAIEKGLMQNVPARSMSVDSYMEQARALRDRASQPAVSKQVGGAIRAAAKAAEKSAAKTKPAYPQAEALERARQNAVKMLNLPENNTPEMRAQAMGYIDYLHGTQRLDRLLEGKTLDPRRATSGPMPYGTTTPELASSYATSKADTSRRATDEGDVRRYFEVAPKDIGIQGLRSPLPVETAWHFMTPEQQAKIRELAPRVGYENLDEFTGNLIVHPEGVNGNLSANHWNWLMKNEAKGNPLTALRHMWYESGQLVHEPETLGQIYRLAGVNAPISQTKAPWTEAQGVLLGKARITNPIDTSNTEQVSALIEPLKQAFARDRSRTKAAGPDQWAKDVRYTPRSWVSELEKDLAEGKESYVWTSIPDKVTAELRRLGFNGIIDRSGKGGGAKEPVVIPFDPAQVRSRFAAFDPAEMDVPDLLKATGGAIKAAAKAAERAAKTALSEADRLKFAELASSGKMHMAKSEQQEIDDLLKGASKFAELRLNWEDPKTYDMVSKLEKKGYKTQVFTGRPDAPTYIFKEPKDIENVLRARTPYEFGKAYGYSDADIAKFYLQRRGGMEDVAAQDWLRDSQNSRLATPPSPEQAARLSALRERIAPQAELAKKIMNENLDKPLGEIEKGGLLKALKEMPKKRGGKVSITDNLDTMRLAVQKRK